MIGPNRTFGRRESHSNPYSQARYGEDAERAYDECYASRANTQYEIAVRASYSDRDVGSEAGRNEYFHSHPSPNLFSGPYVNGQHALFLPGHGDFHFSKSRKRSNLPKESTDIMKQWFDQVCGNLFAASEGMLTRVR